MEGTDNTTRVPRPWGLRARTGTLSVALWGFGLATSLFLIGTWGRAVVVDTPTIEETTRTIIDADVATVRINAWLEDGLAAATATDSDTVHTIAEAIEATPEYEAAVQVIIAQFVDSLFAPEGEDPVVDVERLLAPLVPVVVAEFQEREIPIDPGQIEGVLDAAGTIELDTGRAGSVASVVRDARVFLTQVVLVALALLLVTGVLAMYLADERFAMLRTLSTRVVLSAVSYAVVFRLASWALDPGRGRSPVAGGGSVLLGSNGQVFVFLAAGAALVAGGGAWFARRRRCGLEKPADGVDDDTRELISV
ncbi:MAG: hypothetical protein BMS9Abin20_1428 [Acidimicrobiia bacterium]|nr:MAG: hypothetical protein BMS9Abin20_1428 [Acidimicrobiia bacterium]